MGKDPSSVSVVIPCHNRRKYLRSAVESVLADDYPNLEIIVADDASSDDSLDTVSDLPVRIVRLETNRGPSAARNAAVAVARGELVAFLDSDDLMWPGALHWRVRYLDENPDDMAVLGEVGGFIGSDGEERHFGYDLRAVYDSVPRRLSKENSRGGFNFLQPSIPAMFRIEAFREIGGFDETLRLAEDQDLLCRYLLRYSMPFVPKPVMKYRIHEANTAIKTRNNRLEGTRIGEAMRILVWKSYGLI